MGVTRPIAGAASPYHGQRGRSSRPMMPMLLISDSGCLRPQHHSHWIMMPVIMARLPVNVDVSGPCSQRCPSYVQKSGQAPGAHGSVLGISVFSAAQRPTSRQHLRLGVGALQVQLQNPFPAGQRVCDDVASFLPAMGGYLNVA